MTDIVDVDFRNTRSAKWHVPEGIPNSARQWLTVRSSTGLLRRKKEGGWQHAQKLSGSVERSYRLDNHQLRNYVIGGLYPTLIKNGARCVGREFIIDPRYFWTNGYAAEAQFHHLGDDSIHRAGHLYMLQQSEAITRLCLVAKSPTLFNLKYDDPTSVLSPGVHILSECELERWMRHV